MGLFTNVTIDSQLLPHRYADITDLWQTKDIVRPTMGQLFVKADGLEYLNGDGRFYGLEYDGVAVFYTSNSHKSSCPNYDLIEIQVLFEDGWVKRIKDLTPNAKSNVSNWGCCHPILNLSGEYQK